MEKHAKLTDDDLKAFVKGNPQALQILKSLAEYQTPEQLGLLFDKDD